MFLFNSLSLVKDFQSFEKYSELLICILKVILVRIDIKIVIVAVEIIFKHSKNCLSELKDFVNIIVEVANGIRVITFVSDAAVNKSIYEINIVVVYKSLKTFVVFIEGNISCKIEIRLLIDFAGMLRVNIFLYS